MQLEYQHEHVVFYLQLSKCNYWKNLNNCRVIYNTEQLHEDMVGNSNVPLAKNPEYTKLKNWKVGTVPLAAQMLAFLFEITTNKFLALWLDIWMTIIYFLLYNGGTTKDFITYLVKNSL